jgi:DNA-binding NarL/FixJ family response regulator
MIRVLVVDDDHLMRAGLIEILGADSTINVIGQAATGHQAIELESHLHPDVVLMDIQMPDGDGIKATRQITTNPASAKVLVLTTFDRDDYIFGALEAGASGFLLKRARPEELIAAVHVIAAGDSLLAPEVTRRVINKMVHTAPQTNDSNSLASLTPRERDVLDLLAKGLSNRAIAQQLFVEESTIRTHVKRVLMKLALSDRVQAVIYAYETGLVQRNTPNHS